jgi:gamma-glutamylcyclotransferase (GGCT)/AIG2-like uncharacterized protein YtfP
MRAGVLETECLFVYGTLMPGFRHPMALRLAAESTIIAPATIGGRLYDLGDYPAAVPSSEAAERVHGVLLRLHDPAASLHWLDDYEGCGKNDVEPHAYQRVIAQARLECGQESYAWIYYYRWPLGDALHLAGGRYVPAKPLTALQS